MLAFPLVAILLVSSVHGAPLATVAPLLQPFFAFNEEAPAGAASSVFVEEFGSAGSNVVAYEGICLAYTQYADGLSVNVLDVAKMLMNGTFAATSLRNDTSMTAVSPVGFELLVPATTSPTGRALLASMANLFRWNAASGYPNASAVTVLADDVAVAAALVAASTPTIGVLSYLQSAAIGLPCLGMRPSNNNAFVAYASLRTLYQFSYSANQSASKCVSSGVTAIAYPLIGCITMRLIRNASTCNTAAETLVAQTLRTAQNLLLGTSATGILPLFKNDVVVAYTQFLTASCASTVALKLGGSSVDDFLVRWMISGYNKPGFSASHNTITSSAGVLALSQGQYLAGYSELTVNQVAATTTLGNTTLQMLPSAMVGCPLVYNLPGRPDVRLPRCAVAAIMLGQITMWNDPAIQEVNPQVTLPAQPIKVAIRTDGAGTTSCVQLALAELQRSCNQTVTFRGTSTWMYNSTLQVNGSMGMTKLIRATAYSLGYIVYNYVMDYGLQMPSLIDTRTGEVAGYDTMQVKNITVDPITMEVSFPAPNFPFVTASYIVYTNDRTGNCSEMLALTDFLEWIVSNPLARSITESSGFIPYPESIMAAGLQRLRAGAMCGGEFLFAQPVFKADHTTAIVVGAVGAPMGLLLLLMIAVAIHLAGERKKKQEQVQRSIQLTTDIAGALCEYDLEYVDALLDEYCSNQHHNSDLAKPFRELRGNLGEYRPFIPRYLLPDEVADTVSQSAKSSAAVSQDAKSQLSLQSTGSSSSRLRVASSMRYEKPTFAAASSNVFRAIALAAVDFVGSTYCTGANKSKLTSSATIDAVTIAVHEALAATGGVLHCFIGDSVIASWNSAKSTQQPEKKACHFLCHLQKAADTKSLQMTGAVVSGDAYCHTGGDTKQRTLVVCGPAVFARLHSARGLAQEGGALVIDATARSVVRLDFTTMPYNVQRGELFYEIVKDLSDHDGEDQEWMYRVAKAENTADAQLEEVGKHWVARRASEALRTLDAVSTSDEGIVSRLPALRSRIASGSSMN